MSDASAYRARSRAVRGAARAHIQRLRADRLARRADTPDADPPLRGAAGVEMTVSHAAARATRPSPPAPSDMSADAGLHAKDGTGTAPAEPGTCGSAPRSAQASDPQLSAAGGASAETCAPTGPDEGGHDATVLSDPDAAQATETGDATGDPEPGVAMVPEADPPAEPSAANGSGMTPIATAEPPADSEISCDRGSADEVQPTATPSEEVVVKRIERSDLNRLPGAGSGLIWMLQECGVSSLADLAQCDPDRLRERMGLVGEILDLRDWIDVARAETRSPTLD